MTIAGMEASVIDRMITPHALVPLMLRELLDRGLIETVS
jgi:hypothetical protein